MIARLGRGAVILGCLVGGVSLSAQNGSAVRVTPIVEGGAVSASFSAESAVMADAREVLQSGLLLTLSFVVELKRPSSTWWDHTVRAVSVSASVKFDNLTGTYHVSRSEGGHVTWSERTKDFAEARSWLGFERVRLAGGGELEPNADYYVQVRLTLSPRRTFPFWPFGGDDGSGRADFTYIR